MRMFLKYIILTASLIFTAALSSQNINHRFNDISVKDTNINKVSIMDSAYISKDIFQLLSEQDYYGSQVDIEQKLYIKQKLNNYVSNSSARPIAGYRIRIFFNNNQQARVRSEQLVSSFSQNYPGIGVYRTYDNPYFKVTVGDLRTKSDAVKMLKKLEQEYTAAFIVKENINFPPL